MCHQKSGWTIFLRLCVCVCMPVFVCECVYVCACVYASRVGGRQRGKKTKIMFMFLPFKELNRGQWRLCPINRLMSSNSLAFAVYTIYSFDPPMGLRWRRLWWITVWCPTFSQVTEATPERGQPPSYTFGRAFHKCDCRGWDGTPAFPAVKPADFAGSEGLFVPVLTHHV